MIGTQARDKCFPTQAEAASAWCGQHQLTLGAVSFTCSGVPPGPSLTLGGELAAASWQFNATTCLADGSCSTALVQSPYTLQACDPQSFSLPFPSPAEAGAAWVWGFSLVVGAYLFGWAAGAVLEMLKR